MSGELLRWDISLTHLVICKQSQYKEKIPETEIFCTEVFLLYTVLILCGLRLQTVGSHLLNSLQFALHFTSLILRSIGRLVTQVTFISLSCRCSLMRNDNATTSSCAHFISIYWLPKRGIKESKMETSTSCVESFFLTDLLWV